jgi:hypothetical protein
MRFSARSSPERLRIVCDAPEDLDIFRRIGIAIHRGQELHGKAAGTIQDQDVRADPWVEMSS